MNNTTEALSILHERVARLEQAHMGFSLPNPFAGMSKTEKIDFDAMKGDVNRMIPDLKGLMNWKPAVSIDIVVLYAGLEELRKKLALPPSPPLPSLDPSTQPSPAPSAPELPPAAQKLKNRAIRSGR